MPSNSAVYITSMGSYLPGPPISNDEMESILGMIHGKPSRLKSRILKNNGIQTRHYAMDKNQCTTHQNTELAAAAIRDCLKRVGMDSPQIDLLAIGATQGDFGLPGMASMVQAELNISPCELLTTHGVCSAGVMALKGAANQVRLGEKNNAMVCASELVSRVLKHSHYEQTGRDVDFEAEFLRWMLSDGAGAALLQPHPKPNGISLRIDWIELISNAAEFDVCMYSGTAAPGNWSKVGANDTSQKWPLKLNREHISNEGGIAAQSSQSAVAVAEKASTYNSWQDYPTYAEAEKAGAMMFRQDLRILDNIFKVGINGVVGLINKGKLDPHGIDHIVCNYSSHYFRAQGMEALKATGITVPEERWFTNLYRKGNTGCASFMIILEELFWSGLLKPGEVIFCMIPESARFSVGYVKLTVVEA